MTPAEREILLRAFEIAQVSASRVELHREFTRWVVIDVRRDGDEIIALTERGTVDLSCRSLNDFALVHPITKVS